MILCVQIAGFAAIDAVEKAVEAEPDVILAQAPGAISFAGAALLFQFALHAAKQFGHDVSLSLLCRELTPVVTGATYFRNRDEVNGEIPGRATGIPRMSNGFAPPEMRVIT
jgi:hypothetical protein